MKILREIKGVVAVALLAAGLAGCVTTGMDGASTDVSTASPVEITRSEHMEAATEARAQFRAGNFGNAERFFRRAVEANPQNGEAWLGLAATYDQLRRFDLADKSYEQATRLLGQRVEVHNNLGWSHVLRGDRTAARRHFERARALEPTNPIVLANLAEMARR